MTTPPQDPTPPDPRRRLLRSKSDRLIAGVSGGLGRHFDIDPLIFRIAFVIIALMGPGILLYPLMWILVPADGTPVEAVPAARRRAVGRALLIVVVVVLTFGASLGAALGVAAGGGAAVAAVVLAVGIVLVVAAFFGGARWLVVPAILLAAPATVVAATDLDIEGGFGDRDYRPATVEEIRPVYQLGAGELVIDLRDVDFPPSDTNLRIDLGVGEARVLVPEGLCVAARADIGAGHVEVLGRDSGGLDFDWVERPRHDPGVPRLVIDAEIGAGALHVHDEFDWDRGDRRWFDHRDEDDGPSNREACDR